LVIERRSEMYCPKCGTENPKEAKVCRNCRLVLASSSTVVPNTHAKTSRLAITSLVLGILSFLTFCLTALPALIFGIVGLVKIAKSRGQLKGTGLAIAGIVVPVISIPIVPILTAVIITVAAHSGDSVGGIDSIAQSTMVWIKCRDPKCENTWQMDRRNYFDYIEKNRVGRTVPSLVCPKCKKETGYRAEKCKKCGFIFKKEGSDIEEVLFENRCPKCGYSAIEEMRKKARGDLQRTTEKQ
jgi:ribosomal protein L40E